VIGPLSTLSDSDVTLRLSGLVCAIDEFDRSKNIDALTPANPAVVNSFMFSPKFFYLLFYKSQLRIAWGDIKILAKSN
jgi:hypothetical protein